MPWVAAALGTGDKSGRPCGDEPRVTLVCPGLRALRGTGNKIAGDTGALTPLQSQISTAAGYGRIEVPVTTG